MKAKLLVIVNITKTPNFMIFHKKANYPSLNFLKWNFLSPPPPDTNNHSMFPRVVFMIIVPKFFIRLACIT